jgi:hypothetical protein
VFGQQQQKTHLVQANGQSGREKKQAVLCKQGVCHTVALPFKSKSTLSQKKNYENSNISPCKNILIFQKKNPLKETKILQDIITQ